MCSVNDSRRDEPETNRCDIQTSSNDDSHIMKKDKDVSNESSNERLWSNCIK